MEKTIDKLSRRLGLPKDVIIKTYKAYWLFVKTTIESLPLKEDLDETDFKKARPNVNIPGLGKLYCTYDWYARLKKSYNIAKHDKCKKDKANG